MRYKVLFVKVDELATRNDSQSKPPDRDILIRNSEPYLQSRQSMIIVKNRDNFVERKNALNKMVNTDTAEDFRDNDQKETFQYQVPRVRASFTLKVAPDSTTADLPESNLEPTNNSTHNDAKKVFGTITSATNIPSIKASIPLCGPNLPDVINPSVPDKPAREFRPCIPAQPAVVHNVPKTPKSISANKSGYNVANDDKDFEIPLEESLKAVEDFIKREKELANWHVGEDVLVKWKGNGLYYKAKILDIFPSGIIVVLFDTYDVTDEIDYKELCKYFKKTSNYKKKGRSEEEKLKIEAEKKTKSCAKRINKAKKQRRVLGKRLCFTSVFKRSGMLRRKLLLNYSKQSHILPIIKSKKQAQKGNTIKKAS